MGVPAKRTPRPMWCSRLLWRRVTPAADVDLVVPDPVVGADFRAGQGAALGRAAYASAGVRRPKARWGRIVL